MAARKAFCAKGHEIAVVGRYTASGGCRACGQQRALEQGKRRRDARLSQIRIGDLSGADYLRKFF